MQLEDGIVVTLVTGVVASLGTSIAVMWYAIARERRAEITRLISQWNDLVERVRELEKEKTKRSDVHAERLAEIADGYRQSMRENGEAVNVLARSVRQLAQNVNDQTEAIRHTEKYTSGPLPKPHPAQDHGTDVLTRNQPETAHHA